LNARRTLPYGKMVLGSAKISSQPYLALSASLQR